MTQSRFEHGSENNEMELFKLSLDYLEGCKDFKGIKNLIEKYDKIKTDKEDMQHPNKDISVKFKDTTKPIIMELQHSSIDDFRKYEDIRLDYVSAYIPYIKIWGLKNFNEKINNKKITIKKWGKLKEYDADILIYIICEYEDSTKIYKNIDKILILDVKELQNNLNYWENAYGYNLKTNNKKDECWGSAFIPVPEDNKVLQQCKIKSLQDLKTNFL